jgi:hypothetical protein
VQPLGARSAVTLPHGLWDGRERRSEAELRLPTGADEAYLIAAEDRSVAERVTGLLGRCVVRIGDVEVDEELARGLTVGDREALLLALRAASFGDRLGCILDCPACGERMDVDLRISDLLVAPYAEIRERHAVPFDLAGTRGEAVVRLVTGADQEEAARHGDAGAGLEDLVERCLLEVTPEAPRLEPRELAEALSSPMGELDPQAEITIDVVCPACEEPFAALLDAAAVLFPALTASDERLLREVDAIARVYHWSEAEILGLDVGRRRHYLELLAESVGEAS